MKCLAFETGAKLLPPNTYVDKVTTPVNHWDLSINIFCVYKGYTYNENMEEKVMKCVLNGCIKN